MTQFIQVTKKLLEGLLTYLFYLLARECNTQTNKKEKKSDLDLYINRFSFSCYLE